MESQPRIKESSKFIFNADKRPTYLADIETYFSINKKESDTYLKKENVLENIIYGIHSKIEHCHDNNFKPCVIYQIEPENKIITILYKETSEEINFDITQVTYISYNTNSGVTSLVKKTVFIAYILVKSFLINKIFSI